MLLAALATAERALPLYSHRHSPKKFTQHQLFACLVLKSFLKTDYRGVVAHLADCPSLVEALEAPRGSALHDAAKSGRRLLAAAPARRLLDATVREHLGRKRRVRRAAIDSTGLESSAASGYFVRRRRYVGECPGKPWFIIASPSSAWSATSRRISFWPRRRAAAPSPTWPTSGRCCRRAARACGLDRIVGRRRLRLGANHAFARDECRVRSIIPAKHGRPTTKPASGHYRRLMQTRFDLAAYRDRVQVETVISMIKRRLEAFVRGRTAWSQRRELRLKVLTHNVMILLRIEVFYRAFLTPFRS